MIFTTLIEPRELHAFMLNQKVSGNRNIIILDCSCSIPDPELGIKLYAKEPPIHGIFRHPSRSSGCSL